MTIIHQWLTEEECLPPHRIMLAALPGVGNVGKLVADSVIEGCDGREVLRLMHPEMPPQAKLDNDGLLTPPHLSFSHIDCDGGMAVMTGEGQPMTPSAQHECALRILELAKEAGAEQVIVMAGMVATAGQEEVFMVCSDALTRLDLEQAGADVRRDQPDGGVIGLVGLLSSLGPVLGISSSCLISTTIGASVDPLASDRLFDALQRWFSLDLSLPSTTIDRMAVHMATLEDRGSVGQSPEPLENDTSPMLYS